jgi:hypothetical protein
MNTALPSAGWFPDPQQPGQLRYWDGHGWTGHIHPIPAADTLSLTPQVAGRVEPQYDDFGDPVLFRERTHGAAKCDVMVTSKRITAGKRSIAFADVDTLHYDITELLSFGIRSGVSYSISLQGKGIKTVGLTTQSLPLRAQREEASRQYAEILHHLDRHLVDQLVERLATQILAGQDSNIGGLLLTPDGIHWKRQVLPWAEFRSAVEQGREILIFGPQAETIRAKTFVRFPNARILVRLCNAIAQNQR